MGCNLENVLEVLIYKAENTQRTQPFNHVAFVVCVMLSVCGSLCRGGGNELPEKDENTSTIHEVRVSVANATLLATVSIDGSVPCQESNFASQAQKECCWRI